MPGPLAAQAWPRTGSAGPSPRPAVASRPRIRPLPRSANGPLHFGLSRSALRRRAPPATPASADCWRPFGPPRGGALASRQIDSSPRVRRVTFAPSTRRIYAASVRMTSGFESFRPLAHLLRRLYALRVPRAGALPAASFRLRLAADALAVRLAVPVIRARRGLPPPSHFPIRFPSSVDSSRRHAWRCAPCLAHEKGARQTPHPGEHHLSAALAAAGPRKRTGRPADVRCGRARRRRAPRSRRPRRWPW